MAGTRLTQRRLRRGCYTRVDPTARGFERYRLSLLKQELTRQSLQISQRSSNGKPNSYALNFELGTIRKAFFNCLGLVLASYQFMYYPSLIS